MTSQPLAGKVAVVAGATRGAGRGIATALGEAGATVYCTGRSSRAAGAATPGRPETIEETAERVARAGGHGVAVRVDHRDDAQVRALFERVRAEQGRLDVLVNDIWGGDSAIEWGAPFWRLDMDRAWSVVETALRTHLVTSRHGAPLLMEPKGGGAGGLLVEVTDGDTYQYRGHLVYDLVKTSVIRLAYGLAHELRPHGVAALAVTPGFLRSEAMLDLFGVTEERWRDGAEKDPNFLASETPLFVGRAVAALAADPDVMRKSGRVFSSWDLSEEYGFVDADGARPHWGRHHRRIFGEAPRRLDDRFYAYWEPPPALEEVIQEAHSRLREGA